jgi:hypothetical protein
VPPATPGSPSSPTQPSPSERPMEVYKTSTLVCITTPEPRGIGTNLDEVRKYLGDSSNPLRLTFENLLEENPMPPKEQTDDLPLFTLMMNAIPVLLII